MDQRPRDEHPPDGGFEQRLAERAAALGFDLAAVIPAALLPGRERLAAWLAEGRQGQMHWMARYPRHDPERLLEGARSAIVTLTNYRQPEDPPGDPERSPAGLRIARYARGRDYHDVLHERLERLAGWVRAELGASVAARAATDSAPLLERELAAAAGLGWVGKNTMLLHPRIGSYTLIAELLLDHDLEAAPIRLPDRCGTCSRCIDACPTAAIISPYVLDARRCISYLTIELRDPIPRTLRPLIGDHLFGCDICQDVCPWNHEAPARPDEAFAARPRWSELGPTDLLSLTRRQFNRLFGDTPLARPKRAGLLRNAAVVLGNQGDPGCAPLLECRLAAEPEALVRGHIAWALGQLDRERDALRRCARHDPDPWVREEAREALPAPLRPAAP